jgi:hypothetical protein
MSVENPNFESSMEPEEGPIPSKLSQLGEFLEAERQAIEAELAALEQNWPQHLTAPDRQIAFGRKAARLRGMGEMALRVQEQIKNIEG